MRVKIETVSALEVTTKTPNSFETRAPSTSLCPAGALSAAVMVPFEDRIAFFNANTLEDLQALPLPDPV